MPADNDAFTRALPLLLFNASAPAMAAIKPLSTGDARTACAYARFSRADLLRLQAYVQAYIDKQASRGVDMASIRSFKQQIDDIVKQSATSVDAICARYKQNDTAQSLYNAANAMLEAANQRQDPAVEALNIVIAAQDKPKTCQASQDLLAIVDQKMIALELIKVLIEPQLQDPTQKVAMTAYLTKIDDIQGKTRGLLLQAMAIETTNCIAKPLDMVLD